MFRAHLRPATRRAEVSSLFDEYLAGNAPIATTASGADAPAIEAAVQQLQSGTPYATVLADILSTSAAYQAMGNNYALPAGVSADAIAYGDLSGAKDMYGNPVPDLIVAGSDDNLYIFKGRVGGYASAPTLVLALPAGANPSQIVVADFTGTGLDDIAVANSGLTGTGSVSVFLNTRTAVGQISFGPRVRLQRRQQPGRSGGRRFRWRRQHRSGRGRRPAQWVRVHDLGAAQQRQRVRHVRIPDAIRAR